MSHQRVIIAGASGLIGRALTESLTRDGSEVVRLVRRAPSGEFEAEWHPEVGELDADALRGATAVVNLAGASIGKLPWTRRYRAELWDSRMQTTTTITQALAELRAQGESLPAFVSASAVGYYGDRPGETLTESDTAGSTFMARLCVAWEHAALTAADYTPVALLRTAPVMHPEGVLKPLMLLTKLGVSGPLAGGQQMWPWISLDDEVRAIRHIIDHRIEGPVNLTGPAVASAGEIGRELASLMRRPYLLPAPAWALRLGLGTDAADGLLLSDARLLPAKLLSTGFTFTHPTVREALKAALTR